MDNLDQYELKDITGPIPPEPPFPWLLVGGSTGGIVAFLVVWIFFRRKLGGFILGLFSERKKSRLQVLKRKLREFQKNESTENYEIDEWWKLLLSSLVEKGILERSDLTNEEIVSVFERTEVFRMGDSSLFVELVSLVDRYKFQGGLSDEEKGSLFSFFNEVVKRVETI